MKQTINSKNNQQSTDPQRQPTISFILTVLPMFMLLGQGLLRIFLRRRRNRNSQYDNLLPPFF